jgi:HlyD family secretion protein
MRAKVFLVLILLLGGIGAGLYFYWPFGNGKHEIRLPGTVEIQDIRLSSKVGGRIFKVIVEEGDIVKAGDPLVYIEVPELEAQRDQIQSKVDAAQASYEKTYNGARPEEIAMSKEAMESAKAKWDRMQAGFRPEEVEQAKFELLALEAERDRAKREVDREKQALATIASARSAYDFALATLVKLENQIKAQKAKWEMMQSGYRKEDKAEMRAEYEKAKANYDLMVAGSRSEEKMEALAVVNEWKAKLREMEAMLKEAVITAPDKSVIEVIGVRKGDVVAANQPIIRVLRANDLWVKAYVSEVDLGKVRLNQDVEVTCDAYPNKKFKGTITFIASISEFTPRNVQTLDERHHQVFGIKVRVADPDGVFKAGMAADVYIPLH